MLVEAPQCTWITCNRHRFMIGVSFCSFFIRKCNFNSGLLQKIFSIDGFDMGSVRMQVIQKPSGPMSVLSIVSDGY